MDDICKKISALEPKFKQLGWISGAYYTRCEEGFLWTDAGRGLFPCFISEMRKQRSVFTPEDIEFVNTNVFYLGIKTKSERERLLEDLRDMFDRWGNESLIAMTSQVKKEFSRLEIFDLLDWFYKNNADEIRVFRREKTADNNDWVMKIPKGVYKHV